MYWMLIFIPTFLTALLPRRLRLRPAELAFILAMVSSSIFLELVGQETIHQVFWSSEWGYCLVVWRYISKNKLKLPESSKGCWTIIRDI